jgi:diadenosine tetraphosphate (Ap4A) HIT family hydrolase
MYTEAMPRGTTFLFLKAGYLPMPETCHTCTRLRARDEGSAPLWDNIYRTMYWDVVHSYNTSLPGWLVLILRRHAEAIAELTAAEAMELGILLQRVSAALHQLIGCHKTYSIQFAEAPGHPHVHFHVIPVQADHPVERRGPAIFTYLGVPTEERVPEAQLQTLAVHVQEYLNTTATALS